MSDKQSIFETLSKVDVSNHIDVIRMKKGPALKYVSWSWALSMLLSIYPDTPTPKYTKYQEMKLQTKREAYKVTKYGKEYTQYRTVVLSSELTDRQVPYLTTETGTMVEATVTIEGHPYTESLYVMDNANDVVINPTVGQINKTQKRCVVKALAMAGLGLNLYAGEDLPMGDINESDQKQAAEQKVKKQEQANFQKAKKKYVDYMEQLQEITKQSADVINDQAKQRVLKADPDYNKRTPLEKMLIINTFLEKMLSENKATKQETLEEVDA